MRTSTLLLRPALFATFLSLGAFVVACGDDETTNQGSGGGSASSDASSSASSASTSGSASTTTSSGASTSTASGSTESGSESGPVGSGGSGGESVGSVGSVGSGGAGGGGGSEPCPEQPAPYELGDVPKDACAAFEADDSAPPFHVEFINEPKEVFQYDGTTAVDFAFQYLLAFPLEDVADFTLTESRCQRLAGDDVENCSEGEIDISEVDSSCSVRSGGRFGIDPGGVNPGINEFDFTMTLRTGCAEVSSTFTYVVDYQPQE